MFGQRQVIIWIIIWNNRRCQDRLIIDSQIWFWNTIVPFQIFISQGFQNVFTTENIFETYTGGNWVEMPAGVGS